jgi:hypothetical protein
MTMLQAPPDTPDRAPRGEHLMATARRCTACSAAAPVATYARARIADRLGEHPMLPGVATGISAFHFMRRTPPQRG